MKNICILWIPNAAFYHIVKSLYKSLQAIGIKVSIQMVGQNGRGYVSNPLLMYLPIPLVNFTVLPKRYIAYQIEQMNSNWFTESYKKALRNSSILWNFFDLSAAPDYIRQHRRLAYMPFAIALPKTIPAAPETIDILFVGTLNERRRQILGLIRTETKLTVLETTNLSREEHEHKLRHCKIYLNIHYYDGPPGSVLESARVTYALSRGKTVVSEKSFLDCENKNFQSLVLFGSTAAELAELCLLYCTDDAKRSEWTSSLAQRYDQTHSLSRYVERNRRSLFV